MGLCQSLHLLSSKDYIESSKCYVESMYVPRGQGRTFVTGSGGHATADDCLVIAKTAISRLWPYVVDDDDANDPHGLSATQDLHVNISCACIPESLSPLSAAVAMSLVGLYTGRRAVEGAAVWAELSVEGNLLQTQVAPADLTKLCGDQGINRLIVGSPYGWVKPIENQDAGPEVEVITCGSYLKCIDTLLE